MYEVSCLPVFHSMIGAYACSDYPALLCIQEDLGTRLMVLRLSPHPCSCIHVFVIGEGGMYTLYWLRNKLGWWACFCHRTADLIYTGNDFLHINDHLKRSLPVWWSWIYIPWMEMNITIQNSMQTKLLPIYPQWAWFCHRTVYSLMHQNHIYS